MLNYTKQGTAMMAASALAFGAMALPASGDENTLPYGEKQQQHQQDRQTAEAEDFKTLQGTVVNLQNFLTTDADKTYASADDKGDWNARNQDRAHDRTQANADAPRNAPLGLCVTEEGMIDALNSEETYLIVFDPNSDAQSNAYESARGMIGEEVKLTGEVVERGSISGVLINSIKEAPDQKQASAEQDSY